MPTATLVGDVDPAPLRAAGWDVRGALAASPFAPGGDRRDVAGYLDVDELLADPRVDLAVVDGADPALATLLPDLRRAGLLVLLPEPAPLDVDPARAARAVDGPETGVGLVRRWEPWARTVGAALAVGGGPVLQLTVRGWPRGPREAAELVDLVTGWCGEVTAVGAAPAPLPADVLPDGEQVSWALLTATGATVLVSHGGAAPELRLSFGTARLVGTPDGVRWQGGDALPLMALPHWVPPVPRGAAPGLVATAAALRDALGGLEVRTHHRPDGGPRPADVGDLLVVARVLQALRTSARTERLVATG